MFDSRCFQAFNIMTNDFDILVDYQMFFKAWSEISIDDESFLNYPIEIQAYLMAFYFKMMFNVIKFKVR